jgi:steroid 5-alpha reductase family enzyme
MDFLRKFGTMSNSVAFLVVFAAGYLSAAISALAFYGTLEETALMYGIVLIITALFMVLVFGVSRIVKRTDVVDAAWGPVFVVAAISALAVSPYELRSSITVQLVVTLFVCIWAARLAFVIISRLRSHSEDKRYVELRKKWKGNEALNTFFRIFLVQALLAWVISFSVIFINISEPTSIDIFAYLGVIIWIIGFFFEAGSDLQLKRFLADKKNKGKLLTSGLWRYSRHPNYFGEATMWWGIFIIGLSVPNGWIGIIGPVIITYLLLFVSGVPMTEKAFEGRPGWSEYKKRTNKFFPGPTKR